MNLRLEMLAVRWFLAILSILRSDPHPAGMGLMGAAC